MEEDGPDRDVKLVDEKAPRNNLAGGFTADPILFFCPSGWGFSHSIPQFVIVEIVPLELLVQKTI